MKTKEIRVTTNGEGMDEALAESEKAGISCGLSRKELLRLRLLSEELFGTMRSVTGNVSAYYWIEYDKKDFRIHLKSNVKITQKMYSELVDISTNGRNEAVRGFMGSIKNMIAVMLMPHNSKAYDASVGVMSLGSSASTYAGSGAFSWSMNQYRSELEAADPAEAEIACDELEKSIVANLSDEVTVNIAGTSVEITIFKSF